jgi:NADH-quinone oxidoreductase subunit C
MTPEQLALDKIKAAFPDAVEDTAEFRDETTLIIGKDQVRAVCQLLRDDPDLRYNFLSDIVADDYLPAFPRFAVSYHLLSMPNKHRLRLRTWVEDPDEGPETLADVWPIATWLEMEVWDLMGVRFEGNNSLRRLFLPEDWEGHPLRKDYPLGYEEVQFSFNWQEIDAKKPYATE